MELPTVHVIVLDIVPEANVEGCIRSLINTEYPSFNIDFVTANERNARLVAELFSKVNVIRQINMRIPGIYNLSGDINLTTKATYLAFIHVNIEVDKLWLAHAMNIAILDEDIAVLGMRIIYGDNRESSFPKGRYTKQWGLWEPHGVNDAACKSAIYTYCVDPRAFVMKLTLIPKIGHFTESLDLYGSIQDLCYRAWTRGLKVVNVPLAVVRKIGYADKEVIHNKRYLISKAALYTIIRNYELKTLRRFMRPIIGFHFKRKKTRNWPALFNAVATFIPLILERIPVQRRRALSDDQIFKMVDGEFCPLNAIVSKKDMIVMGQEEEQCLVSGWSQLFSNYIGKQEILCRVPSRCSRFQLYTGIGSNVEMNVEALAGSEPASARVLINRGFVGNIHLENGEHRIFTFSIPPECLPEGVLNGEIQLRYGVGAEQKKGLMIPRVWITKRLSRRPHRKAKIRILMSGYDDFNGPGMKHLYKFAGILERSGFSVLVLYPGSPKSILAMEELPQFDLCDLDLDGLNLSRRTVEEIANFKPDITHLWTPRYIPSLVGFEAKQVHGSKLIIHYEDNEKVLYDLWRKRKGPKGPMTWTINPKTFAMLNELADCFTVICEPLRAYLTNKYHKNTSLLYPGADLKRFRPVAKDPELMDKFALKNRLVLMYAGTIHDANLEDFFSMLEALAIIKKKYPETVLVHCGLDFCKQNVSNKVLELRVQENLLLLGRIDFKFMHKYLSVADILIQPGRNNDFNEYRLPAKLPEYFAMGKPIIMFSAGIGKVLADRKEVLKLYRGDATELAERIEELIINEALKQELTFGARRVAEEMFDWQKNAQVLLQLYKEITQ